MGEKISSKTLTTPKFNKYSTSYICDDIPEFKYCKTFAYTENVTYEEFIKKAQDYKNKLTTAEEDNKKGILDYLKLVLISIIIILIVLGIVILYLKKYKSKTKKVKEVKNEKK